MSLSPIKRIYEIAVGEESIVFYSRFIGEVGRDIAAVKYALGDVYASDISNRSPEDDSLIGKQWFSCDGDGDPLTPTALATFDKSLQKSLMSFQLKHQFLIMNYYWDRGGIVSSVNSQTNLIQAFEQINYRFDADFGTISEATVAVMHGWRPGSDITNFSFVTEADTAVEQIPSFLYDMYVTGPILTDRETIKDTYDFDRSKDNDNNIESRFKQTSSEYRKWLDRVIANAESEVSELQAFIDSDIRDLQDSERYIEYYSPATSGSTFKSSLYTAVGEVLDILDAITPDDMSPAQREELIARAIEPDHLSQVVPFPITNFKIGFFDRTDFSFENLPNFDGISTSEKLDLESKALIKIMEFYNKQEPPTLPDGLIEFIDLRAPSLRPGDVYRAFFHADKRIIDSFQNKTATESLSQEAQETNLRELSDQKKADMDNLIEEMESEYCIGGKSLSDEDSRIQYEKYRSFASKKKLEISRTISQQVIKGRDPTLNPDGIDLDLGILGKAHLSQGEINSLISDGALWATGGIGEAARSLFESEEKKKEKKESPPGSPKLEIEFGELKKKISDLSRAFEECAPDLKNYDIPDTFSLPQEISRLDRFASDLQEHVKRKANFEGSFKDNTKINFEFEKTTTGSKITSLAVDDNVVLTPSEDSALVTQRTVHYVRNVNDLTQDISWVLGAFNGGTCDKPGPQTGVGAAFILRHSGVTEKSKSSNWKFIHEWGKSIAERTEDTLGVEFSLTDAPVIPVLNSRGIELTTKGDPQRARGTILPSFGYEKSLPMLGEDCFDDPKKITIMLKKTLDTKRLLCEFIACLRLPGVQAQIPNIPKLRWPKIPSLLDEAWKNLIKEVQSILSRMACMLLKGILDILQSPMCEERFIEGIFGAASDQSPEVQRALASGFLDTGIPTEKLQSAKDLIDALMGMLSPRELCALLNGEVVNDEVYQIVRTIAETMGLGSELKTREQITNFFIPIGFFVGPALCEELSRYDTRSETCDETYSLAGQIRLAASKGEAITQDQIQSAIDHAEDQIKSKATALDFLMNGGSLQDLLPDFSSLENNPAFSVPDPVTEKAAFAAAKASFGMAEMAFVGSLHNYIDSFFEQNPRFAKLGDQEYNTEANMRVQRALCNLQRFSKQNLEISDFTSIETTQRLRNILYILCDDYKKVSSQQGTTYILNPEPRRNQTPGVLLSGSLIEEYNVRTAIRNSEDNARILSQTSELRNIWSLMFPISAGDIQERTRTISTLLDWSKPIFNGGGLSPSDTSTLNSSLLNKVNQVIGHLQQEISANMEKAFVTKTDSIFLPGLKEFYEANKPLSQQGGGEDDLLSVKIGTKLETILRHPENSLRGKIEIAIKEDFGPGEDLEIARTKIEILDPFFLGTEEPYILQYCEQIPEGLIPGDLTELPRPASYKKTIVNILKSKFQKYKTDNISVENYFSNTNPNFDTDVSGQSFLDAYEGVYEQIASGLRSSRMFTDAGYRERLDLKLRSKFYFDPKTNCFKNPNSNPKHGILNFERLITEEFPEQYLREFASPLNSPITEDFSTPGAFENAMMNTSLLGFVRMCLLETLLKGAISLSVWDIDFVKNSKIYRDYLVEFVTRQIESQQFFQQNKRFVDETIQRLSATNNVSSGLRTIVLREVDGVISSLAKEVFENEGNNNFSQWFLDTIPFVSVANSRANDGRTWVTNLQSEYVDSLRYNNFMYLEDYMRVNGSIRSFRSSRAQIAQAQLSMLQNKMSQIVDIGNISTIPGSMVNKSDLSQFAIGSPESVSLEGSYNDSDDYADTELMSVGEFSSLIQSLVDNNSELSKYFHELSGKIYSPGTPLHGIPDVLNRSSMPSRVIKRTRQHVTFDNINAFSLLLKKGENNANGGGEKAVDKFMNHHYDTCKQTKHGYLFNVLTTGDYGENRYDNYSEGNASSLIRRAYKKSTMDEDRYYVITDDLETSLDQSSIYEQQSDSEFTESEIYEKYDFKTRTGSAFYTNKEEVKVSPQSEELENLNFKASNFKTGTNDPTFLNRTSPSRIVRRSQSETEVLFSTPKNKTTKEEHDLLLEENPGLENEIWEETVIDLVGDAAPIFQFPGASKWVPSEHMTTAQKTLIGEKLNQTHAWFNHGPTSLYTTGILQKLYALDSNSPEVTDPSAAHFTEVFSWNPGDEKTEAHPIKSFGSSYGNKWTAHSAYDQVWDENTRTYYRNDLEFRKRPDGFYAIDYDTEQLTPNEYKIPLRILITQVKNKQGQILKVFTKYVLPQFLDFENEGLNSYRAEKMTAACVDTFSGWQNFIVKSFKSVMLDWYASSDGQYEEYADLLTNPNDPLTSRVRYNARVFKVLRQGLDTTAHPLPPFVKGTEGQSVDSNNTWWGSRFASWVSSSKLYSHACRIEADNSEGNFKDDRGFLDDLFSNPGNLVRKPGNSALSTNPTQEYTRFKDSLVDSFAGSGLPDDPAYTSPGVINSGHSHNFDQFVREMFMNYNLSKHRLYDDSMHDALQAYTGLIREDSTIVQSPGTSTLQTIGNLVSWFSQKRSDSFWGKTSVKSSRWKLSNFGDGPTKDAWVSGIAAEKFWEISEVENHRCGPSLFYNDMRTPIHTMMYNCLRSDDRKKQTFTFNLENETNNRLLLPGNTKSEWNWLLKEASQLNAYTHFYPSTNGEQHYDVNISQLMRIFKSPESQFVDPNPGSNLYIQTANKDRAPDSSGVFFYFRWNLTESQAKSMNMFMHTSEVPSTIHGTISEQDAKETIRSALEDELLPYKQHIIGNLINTPRMASTILARWDAALTDLGITQIIREVTTGYTSLLEGGDQTLISDILEDSKISYGLRASMYNTQTPGDRQAPILGISAAVSQSSVNTALTDLWSNHSNASEEERCGKLKVLDNSLRESDIYSIPIASHEILIADIDCFQATNLIALEQKIEELQVEMKAGLSQDPSFKDFFEFTIPYRRMATALTIHGTTLLAGFGDMHLFLSSTKSGLAAAFNASTLVDPYGEEIFGQYPTAADVANAFGPTGPAGGEPAECFAIPDIAEWAKMIAEMLKQYVKYFPSIVLRGIADQIDPMYKEMKRHYMACEIPDLRNGSWSAAGGKMSNTPLGLKGDEEGEKSYLPLVPNLPVDLFMGLNDIFSVPSDPTRFVMSLDRFAGYIFGGPKPLLEGSAAFRIPCMKINAESPDSWERFKIGNSGRYGHPITPINLLALQTLELPRDRDLRRSICQRRTDPEICED